MQSVRKRRISKASHPKMETPPSLIREERKKDIRRKIRVICKITDDTLFESVTYDISLTGLFVMVHSPKVLNKICVGMELHFYVEYDFDTMIRLKGIVSRVQRDDPSYEKNGFAIAISEISSDSVHLLKKIIASL
ncbi:MAG: PilZ domain-containing protein [Candidatus Aureabacteria bacterium]|nr:PilZ domain-containing protein [Candidatus Auribacterota bacterium]